MDAVRAAHFLTASGLLIAFVLVIGVLSLGARSTVDAQMPDLAPDHSADPISSEELRNLAYPSDFTTARWAALDDGTYWEPIEPDSASSVTVEFQRAAFGLLDGRAAAAVVLATSSGGSGRFYDLHLIKRTSAGGLGHAASRFLGDRIRLQGLSFLGERVRVDFTGFADDDGLCCPSLNVAQEFRLLRGELEMVRGESSPALLAIPEGLSMVGWYGGPTTSTAILNASARLETIWQYRAADAVWLADSGLLPDSIRQTIMVTRGSGLFVSALTATEIPVPLMPAPDACPLNPGPPNPVDPSMIVQQPGNGEVITGVVSVSGVARVFEGTVSLRVVGGDGSVLAQTFTTAEVGGPYFGAFAADIPVSVEERTGACVQVFERSARDGSSVNVVQVGVILMPASGGSLE